MSRYQLWRRRLAPVAFALAIALLARDACNKEHRTHATVVMDLGAAAADARALDAEVVIGGEVVATFHRAALPNSAIGVTKFDAALPAEDADVQIEVSFAVRHVKLVRRIHIVEGSTVTIPLGDALAAGSRAP